MAAPGLSNPAFPWLLYAYPWQPYPRRLIIYLRERRIPDSLITVVPVRDVQKGDDVVDSDRFPPRPKGSLPILAIPTQVTSTEYDPSNPPRTVSSPAKQHWVNITQSLGIISLIEELCVTGQYGFPARSLSGSASTILSRARETGNSALADNLTTMWNPVRTFGTGAGTMSIPIAAKEMLLWVRRALHALDLEYADRDLTHDENEITVTDIVLYQFLEFTDECYGVDMTVGTGQITTDPYGREIKDELPNLRKFYEAFKIRPSAKRLGDKGEMPPEGASKNMRNWAEGVL